MRIDIKNSRREGRSVPYSYVVANFVDESGMRRSKHLPLKGDPDDFIGQSLLEAKLTKTSIPPAVLGEIKQWVEERTGWKERRPRPRRERPRKDGRPGRPTRFPKAVLELLKAAGYKADGARIHRDLSTFFTMETASVRFAGFPRELREAIGSAMEYLEACKRAESALKSASRRGLGGASFEGLLAEELQLLTLPGEGV